MTPADAEAMLALHRAQAARIDNLERALLKLYDAHIWLLGKVLQQTASVPMDPRSN